jgi:hypothetical protein
VLDAAERIPDAGSFVTACRLLREEDRVVARVVALPCLGILVFEDAIGWVPRIAHRAGERDA